MGRYSGDVLSRSMAPELSMTGAWAALEATLPSLQLVFLLSLRIAAVFLLTPVLYAMSMPPSVRMLLVLSLSVAIALGLSPIRHADNLPYGELLVAALTELALGATLALGILFAFAAFDVAGRLLDIQIGFGIAQVFDPVSRRAVPILTSAFSTLAVLVFFLINGHHILLRGIAYSVERFPIGAPWSISQTAIPILKQVSGLLSLGFALAAPVVLCIMLVELSLGAVARNLPQLNMFSLGIPIKIVVGLVAMSLWFAGIGGVMTRAYSSIYSAWDSVFATVTTDSVAKKLQDRGAMHGR